MIPENGRYSFISHATLTTTPLTVPADTTHIVFGTAATTDEYGLLGLKVTSAAALQKLAVPTGVFLRLGNIASNVSQLVTEATAPATTITTATFYKWEL